MTHVAEVRSAADYLLMRRSFKGLEVRPLGEPAAAPKKAVPGRSGRAAAYLDEPSASSKGLSP